MSNIMAAYNPDVLSCLANLSNDEVFTPPEIANKMLDMLPQELFKSPDTKFLDPACKSGVFLREIAKRLLEGLMPGYKDWLERIDDKKRENEELDDEEKEFLEQLQATVDHIFKEQLYGIAITELTSLLSRRSLYCSKYPNSDYSVTKFEDTSGNIRFKRIEHRWDPKELKYDEKGRKVGSCIFCGAKRDEYDRDEGLETHAYEFIHKTKPEEIFNMKFDVIIGNPPYQLSDGGNGKSAKPIYQHFVKQAKKLNPKYLTMIIPSRWFTGGKGLDEFRKNMLSDHRVRKLVDFENFRDVFPGVDLAGGACYFLWDRNYDGMCEVVNFNKEENSSKIRPLDEFDVFIRQNLAIDIVKKIQKQNKRFLSDRVSSRKPFSLPTNYEPQNSGIPCWFIQRIGLKYAKASDVDDANNYLDKWKLLAPKAPIAGQTDFTKEVGIYNDGNTRIAKPGECCTESWIILGAFDTKEEVESYKSYIFTKIVRFLLLQTVVSQDITRKNYCFVPDIEKYNMKYTDEMLKEKWSITEEEWKYIDSRVASVGGDDNG